MVKMRLPVQTEQGIQTSILEVDNSVPVHENEEFAIGICYLLATANGKPSLSEMETWLLLEACRKNDVRPKELYDAYWKAVGDEFVGKAGLEFKHLMKQVRHIRENTYDYPKEGMSMKAYQEQQAERLVGKEGMKQLESGNPQGVEELQQAISSLNQKMTKNTQK